MFEGIKSIVGEGNFSDKEIDLTLYGMDGSGIKTKAALVVWPKEVVDIHKIVTYAKRHDISVVARGNGTGLRGGAIGNNSVVIDMSKFKGIGVNRKEKFALVDAGVVLDDLNNSLKGLYFPIVPSSHKVCTIGGMIATNASGLRSYKYGGIENWILGLEVVDGSGKYIKLNRMEEMKSFVGKEGTSGVIVRAKLRLIEPLEETSISILSFDNITKLMEVLGGLRVEEGINSLELIDEFSSDYLGLECRYHLVVEYSGSRGNIQDAREMSAILNLIEDSYGILVSRGYKIMEDVKIPIKEMGKFLFWLRKNKIPCTGHMGLNVIHPFLKTKKDVKDMYNIVNNFGGTINGQFGIGLAKKDFVDKEYGFEVRKIKNKYDSKNIMNRGKIVDV